MVTILRSRGRYNKERNTKNYGFNEIDSCPPHFSSPPNANQCIMTLMEYLNKAVTKGTERSLRSARLLSFALRKQP
jgi:hypothetical protein